MASLTRSSTSSTVAAAMALTALRVSSSGSPGPAPTRLTVPTLRRVVSLVFHDEPVLTQDVFHLLADRCGHRQAAGQDVADVAAVLAASMAVGSSGRRASCRSALPAPAPAGRGGRRPSRRAARVGHRLALGAAQQQRVGADQLEGGGHGDGVFGMGVAADHQAGAVAPGFMSLTRLCAGLRRPTTRRTSSRRCRPGTAAVGTKATAGRDRPARVRRHAQRGQHADAVNAASTRWRCHAPAPAGPRAPAAAPAAASAPAACAPRCSWAAPRRGGWPPAPRCIRACVASRKPAISSGVSPLMRMARQKAPISRSVTVPSSTWPNRSAACSRVRARAPSLPRPISLMYWLIPMAQLSFSRHDFRLYGQCYSPAPWRVRPPPPWHPLRAPAV
jgi:hypothetical protein